MRRASRSSRARAGGGPPSRPRRTRPPTISEDGSHRAHRRPDQHRGLRGDPGQRRRDPRLVARITTPARASCAPTSPGSAASSRDSIEVFESIDVTLLLVTVTLVLVLLLAIYRSPVIALVPLFVVAHRLHDRRRGRLRPGRGRGASRSTGRRRALLIVLMFGAGTDYCLLIVSRYREELRRFEDKHEAMAHATERTGPAILSAGATVIAAMLVLHARRLQAPPRTWDRCWRSGSRSCCSPASPCCRRCWRRSAATRSGRRSRAYGREQRRRSASGAGSATSSTSARRSRSPSASAILALGALGLLQDRGTHRLRRGLPRPARSRSRASS